MANKNTRESFKGGQILRNEQGNAFAYLSGEGKPYAVIVKCGHCGEGYYIPIMFTTIAESKELAAAAVKMNPRVKREDPSCILEVFEITGFADILVIE